MAKDEIILAEFKIEIGDAQKKASILADSIFNLKKRGEELSTSNKYLNKEYDRIVSQIDKMAAAGRSGSKSYENLTDKAERLRDTLKKTHEDILINNKNLAQNNALYNEAVPIIRKYSEIQKALSGEYSVSNKTIKQLQEEEKALINVRKTTNDNSKIEAYTRALQLNKEQVKLLNRETTLYIDKEQVLSGVYSVLNKNIEQLNKEEKELIRLRNLTNDNVKTEAYTRAIQLNKEQVKQLSKETSVYINKEQILNGVYSVLNKNVEQLNKEEKELVRLRSLTNDSSKIESYTRAIQLNKEQVKQLSKETSVYIDKEQILKGLYDTQGKSLSTLNKERKELGRLRDVENDINNLKILNKAIDENTAKRKQLSSATEQRFFEIGNYASNIKSAVSDIANGNLLGGLTSLAVGLRAATGAAIGFISTGIGAVIAAIGVALFGAIKIFKSAKPTIDDFNMSITGVAKILNLTIKDLGNFSQEAIKRSREIGIVSAKTLADYSKNAAQLGVRGVKNLLDFAETVVKAEKALDGIEGKEGSRNLANFLIFTEKDTRNIKALGDELAYLGNRYGIAEGKALETARAISISTNKLNFSRESILGYAAVLSRFGETTEVSGSFFQKVFEKMSTSINLFAKVAGKSTEEFNNLFKEDKERAFNLVVKGLNEIAKSGGNVSLKLNELGLSDFRVKRAINVLASKTGFPLLTEILNDLGVGGERSTKILGALSSEFKTFSDSSKNNSERLKVAMENLWLSIDSGNGIIVGISNVLTTFGVNVINKAAEFIEDLSYKWTLFKLSFANFVETSKIGKVSKETDKFKAILSGIKLLILALLSLIPVVFYQLVKNGEVLIRYFKVTLPNAITRGLSDIKVFALSVRAIGKGFLDFVTSGFKKDAFDNAFKIVKSEIQQVRREEDNLIKTRENNFKVSKDIVARHLNPMDIYLITAAMYLLMTLVIAYATKYLENRASK